MNHDLIYKPAAHFNVIYGISAAALRGWATAGQLDHIRTPGVKRLYSVHDVSTLLGVDDVTPKEKIGYIYARVSSVQQQPDLERQILDLQEAYPGHVLIKDVAPGANFKRQGLRTLLKRALQGTVKEVVVMQQDRLARLGYDLLEFVFNKAGVRLLVHGKCEGTEGDMTSQTANSPSQPSSLPLNTDAVRQQIGKKEENKRVLVNERAVKRQKLPTQNKRKKPHQ